MKTSELSGAALDWAVSVVVENSKRFPIWIEGKPDSLASYSTDWSKGGHLIERERITLDLTDVLFDHDTEECVHLEHPEWWASKGEATGRGATPLIAAMRCYVASKLGNEVEVPAELI